MMIVMACFGVVALGAVGIITQTQVSNDQLNAWSLLTEWGQGAVNKMCLDIAQGRVIYENDALGLGPAYMNNLEMDPIYPILSTSTLPVIDPAGSFDDDTVTGTNRTGNAFLFVKEVEPFIGDANGTDRRVDIYRLVFYYLSPVNHAIGNKALSLRLVKWESKKFADYNQVISIPAGVERDTFVSNLFAGGLIDYLWVPRNDQNNAFYWIDGAGSINGPDPNYTIEKDTVESCIQSLGLTNASVAWNRENQFWTPDVVPKFGIADMTGDGFPHGLEIQVIGPNAARQIMVRLVLAYYHALDQSLSSNETLSIMGMREY